ncbi:MULTISPECIES: DNA topoisomerase (ATP-hydrolyzing) subunit B [unclassified Actinomyces]|uniref:DNA topoisomerase (ATP-hydrolyzing) subunit B n=1 Tax=unclassified Actinomyces TaxID=2609248 RepID=UPI00289321A9|nr:MULTISPECIES: DNA topoisomerase (ATP-hydrolyzing) subunit B [unclassified Actinomyces]MCL3778542.1 DNA topoisomerase (ATP-hydrolyzing) subunit B [Actinomyces sp. AC-20-1]MCL3789495.1 DNA topoisomerase (ATP-hydrolyzing) subunit B [Actinomyces sp. 187325]MCL3791824.1 DNA topoisomerase (ATP-hydrolyzing) subunit B [Actinomyces sp. 186855]MCL3793503.1 DNA topoisomerase (ATP-hydrolyzing) subunit B [Actinomyces sp. 217892]
MTTGAESPAGTHPVGQGSADYGASDITVLEGLEAVRKRPGMYIGSTGERGLHHLVYEVVDNAVDEALAGYCDHIEVTIQADGGLKVVDNGRGIPVDEHPTEHRPTVEVVMTILHAGGKFGGGGYAVSGGLHGVGISVVNALSTRVDTEIRRQGHVWRMSFADGGRPVTELVKGEATEDTGTTQTFYPDPEVFETVEFDYETLRRRFQQMAFLNKGLRITLTDEREGVTDDGDEITGDELGTADDPVKGHRQVTYCYANGLHDYVAFLNKAKKVELVHPEIIDFEAEQQLDEVRGISLEIAMQWTSAYSESVHTYANTINTTEGGTHEEGFRTALTTLVNRYGREKGLIKDKDDNLTGDDIREGLTAVISVKLSEPQFEGQTKTKLGNTEARTFVLQTVSSRLGDWFDSHPAEAKAIISKALQAAAARVAARKAREATRRKGVLESASMPGKLRDCSSRDAAECEIFIVEGDSAGGSAVGGRDPEHQAIMPIRGKILNVEKARLDRALSSDTIRSLITAFGTGIGEDFDIARLRYGKIVIMADADVDGQHIATLLLTLLFRYMRPLIEQGHTYIAMPPLYRLKWSNAEHEFAYSDAERDELLRAGAEAGRRLPKEGGIQRYKGLGEMNDHELWETTMDPATRILKKVTLDEAADADETFSILMGDDVEQRRSFIQRNAADVRFLDI